MKFIPNQMEFESLLNEGYRQIPVILCVDMPDVEMVELFDRLFKGNKRFLLESGGKARYTIMGGNPVEDWNSDFQAFRHYMRNNVTPKIEGLPKCVGGAFGYFSYDFAWQLEDLPHIADRDLAYDDFYFMICHDPLIIDEQDRKLYIVHHVTDENPLDYDEAKRLLSTRYDHIMSEVHDMTGQPQFENLSHILHEFRHGELSKVRTAAFDKDQFMEAVEKIQEYIRSGDVFQVNLSVRQQAPLASKPIDVYRLLRKLNPSPYMGFFELPNYQIVSCSPELLIKIVDGCIETRPIAGTRPRTGNEEADRKKAEELIHNEKERAEHIMLVDLERNDLGRVCEYGSVEVNEYMVVENYSHVMHIVSNVRGKLAKDEDAFSAIAASFPGGTITGAPKIRTMEVIEECEPVKRGPYTGSMGWIDFNGNMELNILIRTLFVQEGIGYIQAGAGIVIDSQPEQEYKESLRKAEALWRAVQLSEQYS